MPGSRPRTKTKTTKTRQKDHKKTRMVGSMLQVALAIRIYLGADRKQGRAITLCQRLLCVLVVLVLTATAADFPPVGLCSAKRPSRSHWVTVQSPWFSFQMSSSSDLTGRNSLRTAQAMLNLDPRTDISTCCLTKPSLGPVAQAQTQMQLNT